MSTNAGGSKKKLKRKRVDSNATQKLHEEEDNSTTPRPSVQRANDGIDQSPPPKRPIQPAYGGYDASLDSMPILQPPQPKQDTRAINRPTPVHMSYEHQDLEKYMIVDTNDHPHSRHGVLYRMDDSGDYLDDYPGGYAPISEDHYVEGYVPTSDDYYYPQLKYVANNHSQHRKPLGAIATPQVIARSLSPTHDKLKTQLAAEARSQPLAYRGDLLYHARGRVDPSVFYKKQILPPPSSRSLINPTRRPSAKQVPMAGQSHMQVNRVLPIGHPSRFEKADSRPQLPYHEQAGPSTSRHENAIAGPSKYRQKQ